MMWHLSAVRSFLLLSNNPLYVKGFRKGPPRCVTLEYGLFELKAIKTLRALEKLLSLP